MRRETQSRGTRMFRSVIIIALLLLTVSVVAFARQNASYALTILKILDPNAPAAAWNATYHFKIADTTGDIADVLPTIVGEGETFERLSSDDPVEVTVTENMDDTPPVDGMTTTVKSIEVVYLPDNGRITFKYPVEESEQKEMKLVVPAGGKYSIYEGEYYPLNQAVGEISTTAGEEYPLTDVKLNDKSSLKGDQVYTIVSGSSGYSIKVTRASFEKGDGGSFKVFGNAVVTLTAINPSETHHYHLVDEKGNLAQDSNYHTIEHFDLAGTTSSKTVELRQGEYTLRELSVSNDVGDYFIDIPEFGAGTSENTSMTSGGKITINQGYGVNLALGPFTVTPPSGAGTGSDNAGTDPGAGGDAGNTNNGLGENGNPSNEGNENTGNAGNDELGNEGNEEQNTNGNTVQQPEGDPLADDENVMETTGAEGNTTPPEPTAIEPQAVGAPRDGEGGGEEPTCSVTCQGTLLMKNGGTQSFGPTIINISDPSMQTAISLQDLLPPGGAIGDYLGFTSVTVTADWTTDSFPASWAEYTAAKVTRNRTGFDQRDFEIDPAAMACIGSKKVTVRKNVDSGTDYTYNFVLKSVSSKQEYSFVLNKTAGLSKEIELDPQGGAYVITQTIPDVEFPVSPGGVNVQITDTISRNDAEPAAFRVNGETDLIEITSRALNQFIVYGKSNDGRDIKKTDFVKDTNNPCGLPAGDYQIRGLDEFYIRVKTGTGNSISATTGDHVAVRITNTFTTPPTPTDPPVIITTPDPTSTPTPTPTSTPAPTPTSTPTPAPSSTPTPVPPASQGSYRVVHQYYLQTEDGVFFEGASGIITVPAPLELDKDPAERTRYDQRDVEKEEVFTPQFYHPDYSGEEGEPQLYTYHSDRYGHMRGQDAYQVDRSMSCVLSTEDGSQIIILRYIRGGDEEIEIPDDPVPFPSAHPDPTPTPIAKPSATPKPTAKPTPTPAPKSVPKTGAGMPLSFWLTLNAGSLAALGAVGYSARQGKKRGGKKK